MIGRNLAFGMGWWGNNQSDSYRGDFTARRLYHGDFTTETLPRRDFTAETLPRRLYHGDFTIETLPWRLYRGEFTVETLPQRLYCGDFTDGDFTAETFPWRLYHREFEVWVIFWGLIPTICGLLSQNIKDASLWILSYHWLPLATIDFTGW